ncbi:MAG: glycosyltransferase family 1 protein [Magnetococcales bacterium]|nr:glycosyltransferase family 1 protein [Magnetococcales bacterium]
MNLVFADPGLLNNLGHHANSCRHVVFEARRRGIPSAVLAYNQIEDFLRDELLAIPWFRCNPYGTYDDDPLCGWLSNFDFMANVTHEDLTRLHGVGRDDLIFLNSAGPAQFAAMLRWVQSLPEDQRPTVIIEFGQYAGLMPRETDQGIQLSLCYQGDPRPLLLRYIAKKHLSQGNHPWLRLATFDAQASAIYEKLFDHPVHALPLSNRAVTGCRDRTGTRPVTIALLGHQRLEKGFGFVPELAGRLLSLQPDIRILVHNGAPDLCVDLQNQLRTMAAADPRLILDERPAGPDLWSQLLDQSDLVVCPYYRDHFVSTYSALASEAIANAIPLVVPSRTTMAILVQRFGSPGIIYDDPSDRSSPEIVLQGVLAALHHFDALATRAKVASQQWEALNGPTQLLDTMLSWHATR